MSKADSDESDPEIDRINLRISRSFLDVVDVIWRERGFNSRSEFIRYALRDRDTSAYPRLSVSDECSDTPSEPRSEQAGVERTA